MNLDELITPGDVERALLEITARIDRAPAELKLRHEELRKAKAAYRTAYALAYKRADGTIADRKADAELETADLAEALDDKEIAYRYARDLQDSLRTELRAIQSAGSMMRASMFGNHG